MGRTVCVFFLLCLVLEQSNGEIPSTSSLSRDYVSYENSRGRSKIGVDGIRSDYCKRPTVTGCENLNNTTEGLDHSTRPSSLGRCYGAKLPYSSVSLDLHPEVTSVTEMLYAVEYWEILRHIPKCWAVIQPLVCAFHFPRCENGNLYLPSQEMCRVALAPCRLLAQMEDGLPAFLNCNDTKTFPSQCRNDVRELKFTAINSSCPYPLVRVPPPSGILISTDPQRHFPGVEGCSLPCDTPLFSPSELAELKKLVAYAGTVALLLNLFVVATFLVDWGSSARYPALIIFYLNLCCMVSTSGWLLQFIPGARQDILCRRDGTARGAEPSGGENLSCVMVFVLIYYFLMAALVWFVILAYSWHLSFKSVVTGRVKECMDSKSAYFHLSAWSLPLVLTITTLVLGEVHADSSSGVCFVGTAGGSPWGAGKSSIAARVFLLLVPVVVATLAGGFFLVRGLVTLVSVRINSLDVASQRQGKRIQEMIVRISLFSVGILGLCILTIACHIYEYRYADGWHKALYRSVVCHALQQNSQCLLSSQPSLSVVQLHLLAPFLLSAFVAMWLINSKSRDTWVRILRRRCPCCVGAPYYADPRALAMLARTPDGEILERGGTKEINLQKHKVIARAFAKRKFLHDEGRLSISFKSSYGDPVGMEFGHGSLTTSRGFSSTWAANLPHLMERRNAITKPTINADSASSVRRNSVDSDVSFNVRRLSVESRRNSVDSQISLTYSEITAHHQTRSRPRHHHKSHHGSGAAGFSGSRRSGREKRRKWGSHVGRTRTPRVGVHRASRASISSQDQDSQVQVLQALQIAGPAGLHALGLTPNLQQLSTRRTAIGGYEGPSPTLLARLTIPGHSQSSDDDENGEQIEMLALPGTSIKTEAQVEALPLRMADEEGSSGDESSSSSSFSPELSLLATHETTQSPVAPSPQVNHSLPGLQVTSSKSPRSPAAVVPAPNSRKSAPRDSSSSESPPSPKVEPSSSSRGKKSPRSPAAAVHAPNSRRSARRDSSSSESPAPSPKMDPSTSSRGKRSPRAIETPSRQSGQRDSSSSSEDEGTPFLAAVFSSKEFKTPSQTSKTSSRSHEIKKTREIGVQASLDLEEELRKKSEKKKKKLNNSYNAHRLISELTAQNNRSKSAGHC